MSGTAKILKLHYRGDIVDQSIAVIYINEYLKAPDREKVLKDLIYSNAVKKGTQYEELFKLLGFGEVKKRLNRSRAEIAAELDELQAISDEFNRIATGQSRLLISIVTLGFKLDEDFHQQILDEIIADDHECSDGTKMTKQFMVTYDGQLYNMPERAQMIARGKQTRVLLLDDLDLALCELPKSSEYIKPDTALPDTKPDSRSGYDNIQYCAQVTIKSLLQHFTKEKKENERKIFSFPDDLKGVTELYTFEGSNVNPFLIDTE